MTRRNFNRDIAIARDTADIDRVAEIDRGESDGEAVFAYHHDVLQEPLRVQILASDLDDYPEHSGFLVFTECDNVPPFVMAALQSISDETIGKDVVSAMRLIANRLTCILDAGAGEDQNNQTGSVPGYIHDQDHDHDGDDENDESSSSSYYDYDDESLLLDPHDAPLDHRALSAITNASSHASGGAGVFSASHRRSIDPAPAPAGTPGPARDPASQKRLRRDLHTAHRAGLNVGVLCTAAASRHNYHLGSIFSLSLQVRKLGIPEESLEAWGIHPAEYVMLVFKFDQEYHGLEGLFRYPDSQQYAFGRCGSWKPSMSSAIGALNTTSVDQSAYRGDDAFRKMAISNTIDLLLNQDLVPLMKQRQTGASWDEARKLLIASRESESSVDLASIRAHAARAKTAAAAARASASPQPQAQAQAQAQAQPQPQPSARSDTETETGSRCKTKRKTMTKPRAKLRSKPKAAKLEPETAPGPSSDEVGSEAQEEEEDEQEGEAIILTTAPALLNRDHAVGDPATLSAPLIAMQLALRHFARCTEFCMVCHRRDEDDNNTALQVIKPYVCTNPLCLYQYMALGLGPSSEHEIVNQPHVADLLVSFFYAAVRQTRTRNWPVGLSLRVPDKSASRSARIRVRVSLVENKLTFLSGPHAATPARFRAFAWFVLAPAERSHREYHCRITHIGLDSVSFDVVCVYGPVPADLPSIANAVMRTPNVVWPEAGKLVPNIPTEPLVFDGCVYPYEADLDEIMAQSASRAGWALSRVLHTIPPVGQMRQYLQEDWTSNLGGWGIISQTALTLLRWIISSNRSFIVQLETGEPTRAADGADEKAQASSSKPPLPSSSSSSSSSPSPSPKSNSPPSSFRHADPVLGLGGTYMQFQFAQGSAEKEFRFTQALTDHVTDPTKVPSLFAWHGSSLGNWHSIIRTGLDFAETLHGRSYGHGVYLSSMYDTSAGYMGSEPSSAEISVNSLRWPNTALGICGAISLCEIVNCRERFVSCSPHYVINKVDWIQVRYLFVNVASACEVKNQSEALGEAGLEQAGYLTQDPGHPITGRCGGRIKIPVTAIPSARRHGNAYWLSDRLASAERAPGPQEKDEKDDINLVRPASDESGDSPTSNRSSKRRRSSSASDSLLSRPDRPRRPRPLHPAAPKVLLDPEKTEFRPGKLDYDTLPKLPAPDWAAPSALKAISREIRTLQKLQADTQLHELGWYIDFDRISNLFHWIAELHSFDPALPLAGDMKRQACNSIVMEIRFPACFPMSPPFIRVVRPRFLPFLRGGGGHVTAGGAMCMELLTATGWSGVCGMENVLLQIRMALMSTDPNPARLETRPGAGGAGGNDYGIAEAVSAYKRAANVHGWKVPDDFAMTEQG